MSHFNCSRALNREEKLSTVFPVTHFNSPSQFETKNGLIGSTIKVAGVPFITELNSTINQNTQSLHHALLSLDDEVILYVTTHRKKQNVAIGGAFKSEFAKRIDAKYHARFKGKSMYTNHQYLTILIKGNTSTNLSKATNWLKRVAGSKVSDLKAIQRREANRKLTEVIENFTMALSAFNPHLLGSQDEALGYSELMAFLSLVPNAGDEIHFKQPKLNSSFSSSIAGDESEQKKYPNGHIGQYISNKRLLFGENIQFVDAAKEDSRFGAILSIKQYSIGTSSIIFDGLLELDCEFISTFSFAPLSTPQALESIRIKSSQLASVDDASISQLEDLDELKDDIASSRATLGNHHNTLMLLAKTQEELDERIGDAKQVYGQSGTSIIKEILDTDIFFLSQIPGNHHCIPRSTQITSYNMADFCSLHNYQTGFYDGNFLGHATTLLETPSKTPYYFNFHTQGANDSPSSGHTGIFGATDAGKTSWLNFMDSQMERYNNRSFYLDRDMSSKAYILASGNGSYTVFSPDYADKVCLNPLLLPNSKSNQAFLKKWIHELVRLSGEQDVPSDIKEVLSECIDYSYSQLEPQYRTLSNITKLLPIDFPRWPELRQWLKGDATRQDGEYAWFFDNESDELDLSYDKVGIDLTYLMDKVSSSISTPVYMYLVHRMEQAMDGKRPTGIAIEEAWQALDSPFWIDNITRWLPTIRKKNGYIVFLTQSPQTVLDSKIGAIVLDSLATSIYFPNPNATRQLYVDGLNLSESEYEVIRQNAPKSRRFLCKQKAQSSSVLCKLDLSALSQELRILSANTKSCLMLDELIKEKGTTPDNWIDEFIKRSAA